MILKGKFVAMLVGENSELRTRKSDGQPYSFNQIGIMQNGLVGNLRVHDDLFPKLKTMEHFVQYEMFFERNTDYDSFVVTDMRQLK